MKKAVKIISILLCAAIILTALYFFFAFFGNPISWALARKTANNYLEENFYNSDFQITDIDYNFKTGGYDAEVDSPSSQDSYFTIYMDNWGQYRYDTYEDITSKHNTFYRLDWEYNRLIDSVLTNGICPFNTGIIIGELRAAGLMEVFSYTDENGNVQHYTMDKEYGLDRSELILDKEYDIRALGADHGNIVLYIHDFVVTAEHAAELLLEVKEYMDAQNVPFHAIDFHLCEPRNENGQMHGNQISVYDFLYSDIYKDGLIYRVQLNSDAVEKHHAIQNAERAREAEEYAKNPIVETVPKNQEN